MRFCCFVALPALALLTRCGAGDRIGESAPLLTIDPLDGRVALAPVDSVALEQPDPSSAGLPGFDLDASGTLALGDSSNGTVRVYAPDGRLRLTLGRKGSGVGEFSDPHFPRFRGDGTLHVADAANARVTVYGADGTLLRSAQLRPLTSVSGFVPLDDGRYLVTSDDPDGYVLFLFDSAGALLDRFLPIGDHWRIPHRTGPSPRNSHQFWLAHRSDSAFVVSTLSDSLWTIRLTDRSGAAVAIALPDYPKPSPGHDLDSSPGPIHREGQSETAAAIDAGPAGLIVNFTRRTRDGGEPGTAVVLTPGGRWIALEHAPRLLHSGPGTFATLTHAAVGTSRLILRHYRLTTP
jgi:hypothetical protein